MRLAQVLDIGTGRYPGKVARRLRVLNLATMCSAAIWLVFALVYLSEDRLRPVVLVDFLMSALCLLMPLLHRIGPRAGAIAFTVVSYAGIFFVGRALGTDSGMQMHYLTFAAGGFVVLGTRPAWLPALNALVALALILALERLAPAEGGLLAPAEMFASFAASVGAATLTISLVIFHILSEMARAEAAAEAEYRRADALLKNVLPESVANRLGSDPGTIIADRYEDASVLFADLAGFTAAASRTSPADLVLFLNGVYSTFDRLVERHGLEKIKTAGDSYMVVSGLPHARPDHAVALIRLGRDMLDAATALRDPQGRAVSIRIGIASGPVVAGVVGTTKFFFDVWGDTVNVASRMESLGLPGRIQVSRETYEAAKGSLAFESRGPIEVKGKGRLQTWLLAD